MQTHLRVQNEPQVEIGMLFGKSGCIGWANKNFLFVCRQPTPNLDGDEIGLFGFIQACLRLRLLYNG
jgi:hypothetical protein